MFFKKSKKQQNITVTSKKNIANISKRNITDIYKKGKLQIFLRMPQNITNITERTAEYYKYFQECSFVGIWYCPPTANILGENCYPPPLPPPPIICGMGNG